MTIETRVRLRVRYAETDQMGYAYYANHLVWFEVARTELLRARGVAYAELEAQGLFLPIAEVSVKYLAPLRYDDELEVCCRQRDLGRVSLDLDYEITRVRTGELCATGSTRLVSVDKSGKPTRLPARVRKALE